MNDQHHWGCLFSHIAEAYAVISRGSDYHREGYMETRPCSRSAQAEILASMTAFIKEKLGKMDP